MTTNVDIYGVEKTTEEIMKQAMQDMAKKSEAIILSQLGDLITKGLLVIESTQPVMIMDENNQLRIEQAVRIVLKDHEYIDTLEKTNRELREILTKVRSEQ